LKELGFKLRESSSNFVFAEHQTDKAKIIFDKLVERKIYVRYWDLPGIDNKLRISVGTPEQNDKLLSALKEIVAG
jgi:histidinol-phosphate aminotransferase